METTEITKNWRDVIKAAFPHTVPVLTGYLVLGMTYGILMQARGYGPLWSTLVSIITYGGSAQYAAIVMFAGLFDPVATFILSLTVNARYLFCSVGMLNKFTDTGRYRPFLFFSLGRELRRWRHHRTASGYGQRQVLLLRVFHGLPLLDNRHVPRRDAGQSAICCWCNSFSDPCRC